MNKLLLTLMLISISLMKVFAQCQPDPVIGQAYIYPEKIAFATDGQNYNQVITFRVPADSDIVFNGAPIHAVIDSARLLYIGGIPSGFVYNCNITNCTWKGGTNGCALLEGKSDGSGLGIGEYPIKIYIQTWFHAAATALTRIDSSSNYTFKILAVGIFEVSPDGVKNIFPNPSTGKFRLELIGNKNRIHEIKVTDQCGREVLSENKLDNGNEAEINLPGLPAGIYFAALHTDRGLLHAKLILH